MKVNKTVSGTYSWDTVQYCLTGRSLLYVGPGYLLILYNIGVLCVLTYTLTEMCWIYPLYPHWVVLDTVLYIHNTLTEMFWIYPLYPH